MGQAPLSPDYCSGHDFAVEVEGVRFRFNSEDFASRTGAAAVRLGLLPRTALGPAELRDLVALAAHGRIARPSSPLATHVAEHRAGLEWQGRDLVHWLRRLIFRGAWIDQQIADGRIVPVWEESHGFRYRSATTGEPAADEPALPDWSAIAYRR
jgi:cytosine/adenosine deaminase-related metal-dependent hydrolase